MNLEGQFATDCGSAPSIHWLEDGKEFDLLLSDIALGAGMRGTELAAKAQARVPGLAIVLMSGFFIGAVMVLQTGSQFVRFGQTGLTGDFDFTVDLTPDESRPSPMDPSLLIAAMRDQLGLKVTSQKAPVDFLVIDSAEKVAGGN